MENTWNQETEQNRLLKNQIEKITSAKVEEYYRSENSFYEIGKDSIAEIILTILNLQPAFNREVIFENEKTFTEWLQKLKETGLHIETLGTGLIQDKYVAYIIGGKEEKNVATMKEIVLYPDNYNTLEYEKKYGILMGFPNTAIDAFVQQKELSEINPEEQPDGFCNFRYSKAHENEERSYHKMRNDKLREYAPQLFS